MATNDPDQPGRAKPNESENQPGFEPESEEESESQRQSQGESEGGADEPSQRQAGFDDQRKDEVSGPPAPGEPPDRKSAVGTDEEKEPKES
jgi:hypothetical protein